MINVVIRDRSNEINVKYLQGIVYHVILNARVVNWNIMERCLKTETKQYQNLNIKTVLAGRANDWMSTT